MVMSPSLSPQLDDGRHGAVAEGIGGAAAVREELPGLQGHREHVTSVSITAARYAVASLKQWFVVVLHHHDKQSRC